MAQSEVASALQVQQWADGEFFEYQRLDPLKFLTGTGENSVIHYGETLGAKPGITITRTLIGRLSSAGVTDGQTLEGNEESQPNHGCSVTVHELRNGVIVGKYENIKSTFDLAKVGAKMLRSWMAERSRDLKLARFACASTDGTEVYSASSEATKDAWLVANNPSTSNGRILFGALISNATTDHSSGLANIDGTADDLHQDMIRLERRRVQGADPHVRPVMVAGDEKGVGGERYYALAGSLAFRDLQANMDTIHQNADVRGDKNIIFAGGAIKVGNVFVFEMPEMDRTTATSGGALITGVGAGAIDVSMIHFCGAQALILEYAQRMQVIPDDFDYKNKRGVAVEEVRGCTKSVFNSFDHGYGRIYASAVGD
jgi:hypothetical protein